MRVKRRLELLLGDQGRHVARCGEPVVGGVARRLGVERRDGHAGHLPVRNGGDQGGVAGVAGHPRRRQPPVDQQRVGRFRRQRVGAGAQLAGDVALGQGGANAPAGGDQRVQRGADIDAAVAGKALDGHDAILGRGAVDDGEQAHEPVAAFRERRDRLRAHAHQRLEMRLVGAALDRLQGAASHRRILVLELEADQCRGDDPLHAGVRSDLGRLAAADGGHVLRR